MLTFNTLNIGVNVKSKLFFHVTDIPHKKI